MIDAKKYEEMISTWLKVMTEHGLTPESEPVRMIEASIKFSPARKTRVANSIWLMFDTMVELQTLLGVDEQNRKECEEWRDQLWQLVKHEMVEPMNADDINIEIAAARCAAAHLKDGWNLQPTAYRVVHFPDDQKELHASLRHLPTNLEIVYFEREMWRVLAEKRDGA
jgi:hypothetical protein